METVGNQIELLLGLVNRLYMFRCFSSAKEARISSASSKTKLEVKNKGVLCSPCWVCSVCVRMALVSNFFGLIWGVVYNYRKAYLSSGCQGYGNRTILCKRQLGCTVYFFGFYISVNAYRCMYFFEK